MVAYSCLVGCVESNSGIQNLSPKMNRLILDDCILKFKWLLSLEELDLVLEKKC